MTSNLSWRRCEVCGQLALVPETTATCWRCGATQFDRALPAIGITPFVPVDPPATDLDDVGQSRSQPEVRTDPFPSRRLTAEERETSERLLAQVFSHEIEV